MKSEDEDETMVDVEDKKPLQKSNKRSASVADEPVSASEDEPPVKKQRTKTVAKSNTSEKENAKSRKASPKIKQEKKPALAKAQAKGKGRASARKVVEEDEDEEDATAAASPSTTKSPKEETPVDKDADSEVEEAEAESEDEDEKPEVAAKARAKVQSTLTAKGKDPYPDWKAGEPVPYAALCTTFSKIEMTTKRLEILAHCSLFLRQVLRLTPSDLLPTILLMINKLAADYAGVELGIGESLIMKAIGESTGRSMQIIKQDQNEIGDLGLVAAKSRGNQPTMFKPRALTIRGVHTGLLEIATIEGQGSQGRKVSGIKKLLSAADADKLAGKGNKGVDITKDKGGPSEAKFIVRTLEGKLRLGLAEKTVLVAVAQAITFHEVQEKSGKIPSTDQLAKGETTLKSVYRYVLRGFSFDQANVC